MGLFPDEVYARCSSVAISEQIAYDTLEERERKEREAAAERDRHLAAQRADVLERRTATPRARPRRR